MDLQLILIREGIRTVHSLRTPEVVAFVLLFAAGLAFMIRVEVQHRKKMRQEAEEIRRIKRY
jgi:hypothetical protein